MLLTRTMNHWPEIGFRSYDRLFPSQDTMPIGGFGNLIALPLQRRAREKGNSIFVDEKLSSLIPIRGPFWPRCSDCRRPKSRRYWQKQRPTCREGSSASASPSTMRTATSYAPITTDVETCPCDTEAARLCARAPRRTMCIFAKAMGREREIRDVRREVDGAEVAEACADIRTADLSDQWSALAALHPAPQWLWRSLVSRLVSDGWTVEQVRLRPLLSAYVVLGRRLPRSRQQRPGLPFRTPKQS